MASILLFFVAEIPAPSPGDHSGSLRSRSGILSLHHVLIRCVYNHTSNHNKSFRKSREILWPLKKERIKGERGVGPMHKSTFD